MRPKKKLSELSAERLRKLSPTEIQRRQQLEELENEIKFDNVLDNNSNEIDLKNIESISEAYKSVADDLEFIEYVIKLSKNDISKNGLFSESVTTFKDFIGLKSKALKDLVFINKELRGVTNNQSQTAFIIPTKEELNKLIDEI